MSKQHQCKLLIYNQQGLSIQTINTKLKKKKINHYEHNSLIIIKFYFSKLYRVYSIISKPVVNGKEEWILLQCKVCGTNFNYKYETLLFKNKCFYTLRIFPSGSYR